MTAVTAAAFLGAATLTPTPASAVIFLIPFVFATKKDPNWDAKQAQAAKKLKVTKKSKKKKM
jgi:hypothetical protein